jgi:hypothetical protein
MPEAPPPDTLEDWETQRARAVGRRDAIHRSAVELRLCDGYDFENPTRTYEPRQRNWVRVKGPLPDDPVVHVAVLVYLTDRALLMTAARAHGLPWDKRMSASLDHAVWIHRPIARGSFMLDQSWMLYASESPVGHAARSLIFGGLYTDDGVRFASVVQEGLIRAVKSAPLKRRRGQQRQRAEHLSEWASCGAKQVIRRCRIHGGRASTWNDPGRSRAPRRSGVAIRLPVGTARKRHRPQLPVNTGPTGQAR